MPIVSWFRSHWLRTKDCMVFTLRGCMGLSITWVFWILRWNFSSFRGRSCRRSMGWDLRIYHRIVMYSFYVENIGCHAIDTCLLDMRQLVLEGVFHRFYWVFRGQTWDNGNLGFIKCENSLRFWELRPEIFREIRIEPSDCIVLCT